MTNQPLAERYILIVDDEPSIRMMLADVLMEDGYAVVTASNGADALVHLRDSAPPCLILLDLMMPVMDGWRFRAVQLDDPKLRSIPVVVLSAGTNLSDWKLLRALDAAAYVAKPLDIDRLLETVTRICP